MENPLKNKNHEAFCLAYMKYNYNATKAYCEVYGVGESTGGANGNKLLKNAKVLARIEHLQAQIAKKVMITREELIMDLIDIKNSNKTEFAPSALKAIEIINKMLGFNEPERIEHSGIIKLGIPGVTDSPEDMPRLDEDNEQGT